jgi:hypothetical protein
VAWQLEQVLVDFEVIRGEMHAAEMVVAATTSMMKEERRIFIPPPSRAGDRPAVFLAGLL